MVVLKDGLVEQTGSPEHLWNSPCNDFVAEFLSNAIIVTARPLDEHIAEIVPGLSCRVNRPFDAGKPVRLALRKDDCILSNDGVEAVITYSEYNGGIYHMKAETKEKVLIPVSSTKEIPLGTAVLVNVKKNKSITVVGT